MPLYRDNLAISLDDAASAKPLDNGIVPEAYRCWMDEQGLEDLRQRKVVPEADLNGLQRILNQKFDSGARLFGKAEIAYGRNKPGDMAIRKKLEDINPLWHYQRWPGGSKAIIFEGYPTSDDIQRILDLNSFFAFASGPQDNHFFGALENVHNLIHNFSGGINPNYQAGDGPLGGDEPYTGDMVNAGVTAFDPIFWGHHSNCDRLWWEWQLRHHGAGPDNPNAVLVPWNMTVGDTASTEALGYTYMQSGHLFRTDSSVPIERFRSAPAEVHPQVAATHRRAEVNLHRVRYVTRAGFHIRVYLNQPEANADTPTRGNDSFVGQLNMFTGLCIGGPGHCDPPPERQRKFDHRKRPHKTPGNFRLDATDTVRTLRSQGAQDFEVNLVVLNTDGTPAADALHLDAVSLDFFD
jgi:tyrosinase